MTSQSDETQKTKPPFPDVDNFRVVSGTSLYRSCKPDNWDQESVDRLQTLGVRSIVDLRAPRSIWEKNEPTDAEVRMRSVEQVYPSYTVTVTSTDGLPTTQIEQLYADDTEQNDSPPSSAAAAGKHFYVPLVGKEFVLGLVKEAPWYRKIQIVGGLVGLFGFGSRTVIEKFPQWAMTKEDESMVLTQYKSMVKFSGHYIAQALHLLSDPAHLPSVLCCVHGKDRTGVLAVMVQHICGLPWDEIARDYARSKDHIENVANYMGDYVKNVNLDDTCKGADPITMTQLLEFIHTTYGSVDEYLDSIGFARDDRDRLRGLVKNADIIGEPYIKEYY